MFFLLALAIFLIHNKCDKPLFLSIAVIALYFDFDLLAAFWGSYWFLNQLNKK